LIAPGRDAISEREEMLHEGRPGVSIRSVLVHLDPQVNVQAVLAVALDLARQHRAHVVGLHPAPQPAEGAAAMARTAALEQAFRDQAMELQLSHEWSLAEGHEAATLVLEARTHDLLVLGQAAPSDRRIWPQPHHLLETALIKSGHPLIAVPYRGTWPSVGERVLVAWNGAREAARAVEDALPILERADRVTVVTVDLRAGEALSVGHLETLLERHGVNAAALGARSHGRPIGAVLLAEAHRLGCDLLVMGGYGHAPLREHLFGGATHHVVEHMDLPVLLSH
jgi:nucleotide-binding universal stress UspA family protein